MCKKKQLLLYVPKDIQIYKNICLDSLISFDSVKRTGSENFLFPPSALLKTFSLHLRTFRRSLQKEVLPTPAYVMTSSKQTHVPPHPSQNLKSFSHSNNGR